mmetsp:Transcript_16966/g.52603  ORF Transcript_16966/g.52603 Transcript_16966/m.52603 type:complete len:240 (+) Transcript_16966:487-1206(+)
MQPPTRERQRWTSTSTSWWGRRRSTPATSRARSGSRTMRAAWRRRRFPAGRPHRQPRSSSASTTMMNSRRTRRTRRTTRARSRRRRSSRRRQGKRTTTRPSWMTCRRRLTCPSKKSSGVTTVGHKAPLPQAAETGALRMEVAVDSPPRRLPRRRRRPGWAWARIWMWQRRSRRYFCRRRTRVLWRMWPTSTPRTARTRWTMRRRSRRRSGWRRRRARRMTMMLSWMTCRPKLTCPSKKS